MTAGSSFIKPQYGGRCFADLPSTIQRLLTGAGRAALAPEIMAGLADRYDTVIFLFIDSFGWRFFEQAAPDYPALQRFLQHGRAEKITAQFPSTTAAHVTTIHSGLPAAISGVYEWFYYEPQVDAMIAPLLFSFAGDETRDTLTKTGIPASQLFPTRTIYQALAAAGVKSLAFQHVSIAATTFSKQLLAGAETRPFKTITQGLVNLAQALAEQQGPAYFFFYYDEIDAICHRHGPAAVQTEAEIDTFLSVLERQFFRRLRKRRGRTLLMLTADHGQMGVNPRTTIYLNRRPEFVGLERFLKHNRQRYPLMPAGSPRDLFLAVHDERLDEAQAFLRARLAGRAEVHKTADLIAAGFFGPLPPAPVFLARVGNLVILPLAGEAVFWYEKDRFEQKYWGHHGGLSREEMEIPLLLIEI